MAEARHGRLGLVVGGMYHVCSQCGGLEVVLKCDCVFTTYYCNVECQQAHSTVHHHRCSKYLFAKLVKRQAKLAAVPGSAIDATNLGRLELEQDIAVLHCMIGRIMGISQLPANYSQAAEHCREALVLHRRVRAFRDCAVGMVRAFADVVVVDKSSRNGLYDTLYNLADICRLHRNYTEAIEIHSMVIDDLRRDILQQNSVKRQTMLAFILGSLATVHVNQHHDNVNVLPEGHVMDNKQCHVALDLLTEAISLWDKLSSEDQLSVALCSMGTVYNDLGLFEDAHNTLQRALLTAEKSSSEGDSMHIVSCHEHLSLCHQQLAFNYQQQALELRKQLCAHHMFLITNSMEHYHLRFNTVRVSGLQMAPQYNGLEAVVQKVGTERITVVLLWEGAHKTIRIKPAHATPLICTPADLLAKCEKLQQLTALQIQSSTVSNEMQFKMTGDKHYNSVITCYTLASAYMKTFARDDTMTALNLFLKANSIRLRMQDEYIESAYYCIPQLIQEARDALEVFDIPGVLSPMLCCWPPSSRDQDEKNMESLFVALQTRIDNTTVSSEAMLDCLRLYGLFNVTAPVAASVRKADFVATACDELHKMKQLAI